MTASALDRLVARWTERLLRLLDRLYAVPVLGVASWLTARTTILFLRRDGHLLAAALAFFSVLSLIPLLLLILSLAGYLLESMGHQAGGAGDLFAQISDTLMAVVPFLSEDILEQLQGLVRNRGTYGITGLVIMLLTSGLVFRCLEQAIARIFEAERRRRSVFTFQLLFAVFLVGLGLTLLGAHQLGVIVNSFMTDPNSGFLAQVLLFFSGNQALSIILTVAITGMVFVALIKTFATAAIRWRPLLAGGLLFSGFWLLAVQAFGIYLEATARFSLLYGSLATLAVLVVWMYYTAIMLLLCAVFVQVLQTEPRPPKKTYPLGLDNPTPGPG